MQCKMQYIAFGIAQEYFSDMDAEMGDNLA